MVCTPCYVPLCCRAGLQFPNVEIRFKHVMVEADVHVGTRALPSVPYAFLDTVEVGPSDADDAATAHCVAPMPMI